MLPSGCTFAVIIKSVTNNVEHSSRSFYCSGLYEYKCSRTCMAYSENISIVTKLMCTISFLRYI
jgi:hypothetical protein